MEQKDMLANAADKKTVAVTGASGYIGSAIVKLLLEKGYKVHGTARDPNNPIKVAHLKRLPKARDNLLLFKADLINEGCFDDVFEGCDCVFHTASPVLAEIKCPEDDVMKPAIFGTLNVLKSCEKAGVKVVVITSSTAAVNPNPRPAVISEKHWSDPEDQKKRGRWYSASKTISERASVEFLAKMPVASAFRLVRICPALVIGPMLQPIPNLSMISWSNCANGTEHSDIKNSSMSLIDVRDCAAHHVAAYEGDHEGRFLSLGESWPWSLIYAALKHFNPEMKCPKPMAVGVKPARATQYDLTRMKTLGVNERSVINTIAEGVEACRERGMLKVNE